MAARGLQIAPAAYARTGGALYLLIFVCATFGEVVVRGKLIVSGDAAATAANILASPTLFRAGIASQLVTCICDLSLAMIFYALLRPVNRNIALLSAFFRVTYVGIYGVANLLQLAAVTILTRPDLAKAFDQQQLHTSAYLALSLDQQAFGLSLIFFGGTCILLGYLIYQSTYLPRTIGVLLVIAGVCYIVNTAAQILSPTFAATLFPWILLPAVPAELGITLWLLIWGVNVSKWNALETPNRSDSGG